jgi:hypothetical protein
VPQDSPYGPGTEERYAGARALWLKVIVRAAFDWVTYRDSDRLQQKKLAENAFIWLFEPSKLFNGFENICFYLDIDPERVREKIRMLSKDQVVKIEHAERDHGYSARLLAEDNETDFNEEY